MTEAEWLVSADPTPMLEFLRGKASDRKLRLFGCGCCRRVWEHLPNDPTRTAVEVAERLADGLATPRQQSLAANAAGKASNGRMATGVVLLRLAFEAAQAGSEMAVFEVIKSRNISYRLRLDDEDVNPLWRETFTGERAAQAPLLRDIFGNSFRPATLSPSWLTPTVITLARQMYDTRDFSAMPLLADASEDAGCDHPDVLAHCRGNGSHVRGCWVVDLVLGKT